MAEVVSNNTSSNDSNPIVTEEDTPKVLDEPEDFNVVTQIQNRLSCPYYC